MSNLVYVVLLGSQNEGMDSIEGDTFDGVFKEFSEAIEAAKTNAMAPYFQNPQLVSIRWDNYVSVWGQGLLLMIDEGDGGGFLSSGVSVVEVKL